MTNYWKQLTENKIKEFIEYINNNDITQTEAAKLLSVSKGQLSHLLKGERTVNDFIFSRMNYIIEGKRPQITGGIYGIYFEDKLIYIGRTKNFESRFRNHKSQIKSDKDDNCPFHQSGLDVSKLSYKILFNCEKKFLYLKELNRIEELMIRVVLPEWNTDIASLSSRHCSVEEKVNQLIEFHDTHLTLLNKEINEYELPITPDGEQILLKANEYSDKEIITKAKTLISNAVIRPIIGSDSSG